MPTYEQLPRTRAPRIVVSLQYGFTPRDFMLNARARFGDTYVLNGLHGEVLLTSAPEHVRRIFAADSNAFSPMAALAVTPMVGERSVFVTSGPLHKRQRKLLAPALNGQQRLREFAASIQGIANHYVDDLLDGGKLRALDLAIDFTVDVVVRTIFGATDEDETRLLRHVVPELVHSFSALFVAAPQLQKPWFPMWRHSMRTRDRFRSWAIAKIRRLRMNPAPDASVLSLLIEARYDDGRPMDDDEICDQLTILVIAGHETSSITLANCMSRVCQHPDSADRLRQELSSFTEDVSRAPYLSAFVNETLRLDSPATDVGRIANQAFVLDDQLTMKEGQRMLIPIDAVHTDPRIYDDPFTFRPERFLSRRYMPHEFLSFGGGVRRCIGAAFSELSIKILLATLLRRVRWTLTRTKPDRLVRRNVTVGPKHGVPIRIEALR